MRVTGIAKSTLITLGGLSQGLIVEDGSGLDDATSYVGVSEATSLLQDYPDQFFSNTWTALTSAQKEQALNAGTFWLDDKFRFYGQALTDHQALQWPRTKNYDRRGRLIQPGTIFTELKVAASIAAIRWVTDSGLFNEVPAEGQVRSFSLEGASISFDPKESAGFLLTGIRIPEIELLLKSVGEYKVPDWWTVKQTEVSK